MTKTINDENFSDLPKNVQLYVNTLRSLMGMDILEEDLFENDIQDLWLDNIKARRGEYKGDSDFFIHDLDGSDKSWDFLNNIDSNFDNEEIIKYIGDYFWFAFRSVPTEDFEVLLISVTPKGFFDDGRVGLIFDERYLKNNLVSNLFEVMESTLEFETETSNPEEKIKEACEKMGNLGIDYSIQLQDMIPISKEERDFLSNVLFNTANDKKVNRKKL